MAKRRFRSRGFRRVFRRRRNGRSRRVKRFIKSVVRRMSEVKYNWASNVLAQDAATPAIINITPTFAQGTTKQTRIGDKIRYKFMQFRSTLACFYNGNIAQPVLRVRVIGFWTRINLPAVPGLLDILDANNVLSSIRNTAVRVWMDKTYLMAKYADADYQQDNTWNPSLAPGMPFMVKMKKKFRVKNNVAFRNAANTLPEDPKDNAYIIFFSDAALIGQATLTFNWFNRMSFIDL